MRSKNVLLTPSLPQGQTWLIYRMQALGYEIDKKGMCFGIAHMAIQSLLVGEFDAFKSRLFLINCIPVKQFKQWIEANQNNSTRVQNECSYQVNLVFLPEENLNIIVASILAFFDGIELFQNSPRYNHLFGTKSPSSYLDIYPILNLIQSQKAILLKQTKEPPGGTQEGAFMTTIGSFSGIYDKYGLGVLFGNLEASISDGKALLRLEGSNHTIVIGYNQNRWFVIDANNLPVQDCNDLWGLVSVVRRSLDFWLPKSNLIKLLLLMGISLASVMYLFFSCDLSSLDSTMITIFFTFMALSMWSILEEERYLLTFETIVYAPSKTKELASAIQSVQNQNRKVLHERATALDVNNWSLLYIAVRHNHLDIVDKLLTYGVNVNQAAPNGEILLLIASQNGHSGIIVDKLLAHGDDVTHLTQ